MFTGNYPFTGLWPLFQIDPFGLLQEWWRERERERERETMGNPVFCQIPAFVMKLSECITTHKSL